jgi:hypothetical protein
MRQAADKAGGKKKAGGDKEKIVRRCELTSYCVILSC